jgi:DNA-binding NarL/FixJ family response regulator
MRLPSSPLESLTRREVDVLTLIAQGYTSRSAAQSLGIAFKTVVCHRMRIQQKLDIHDTANLTRYAIRNGMVLP